MSSINISIVKWIVEEIEKLYTDNIEDNSIWSTSLTNIESICNNFGYLLKEELKENGSILTSCNNKYLISYKTSFFSIILITNTQSINFKLVHYHN